MKASFTGTSVLISVLLLCSLAILVAHGSVVGIDLGGEFIKMTGPKNNNIDIILNEQAHRKIMQYIGFRSDERYFGEDAKNFAARFPDNMFGMMHRLVGVPFNNTELRQWLHDTMQLHPKLEPTDKVHPNSTSLEDYATVSFRTGSNPNVSYPAEALLGMLFTYLRTTAEKDTGLKIRDTVVTVPAFFTARQRQGIIDAAALGGLNVVSLLHSTTATAMYFGIQNRGFGEKTYNALIYDMGSTRTEVGVYQFTPPPPLKAGQKQKLAEGFGVISTLSIVADPTLGGRTFDYCLAKLFEDRAVEKMKIPRILGGATLNARKAVVSIMRAANKAKEMLSANKVTPVTVEGIAGDREFNTVLTREEFETQCEGLITRAVSLVPKALEAAGLTVTDISSFELMGGGGRIPKIVESLSALRGKPIDRTLNADEAAAFGAGYYASVASGRFRIKSFALKEPAFPMDKTGKISFLLSATTTTKAPVARPLFPAGSLLGSRKSITLNRTEPFTVTLHRDTDGNVGVPDAVISISGIEEALKTVAYYSPIVDPETGLVPLNHPNNSHTVVLELKMTDSGIVSLVEVEARISYAANVSKKVKVNRTTEDIDAEIKEISDAEAAKWAEVDKAREAELAAKAAAKAAEEAENPTPKATEEEAAAAAETAEKAEAASGEEGGATATATDANATDANATAADEYNATAIAEKRELILSRKIAAVKTFRTEYQVVEEMMRKNVVLTSATMSYSFPRPLSAEDSDYLKSLLRAMDESDELKRLTAAAKNDLDTFLVWAKNEGIIENSELRAQGFMSAEEEKAIAAALKNASDWMEEEGSYDATTKEQYIEQLAQLKLVAKDVLDKWENYRNPPEQPKANATKANATKGTKANATKSGSEKKSKTGGSSNSKSGGGAKTGSGGKKSKKAEKASGKSKAKGGKSAPANDDTEEQVPSTPVDNNEEPPTTEETGGAANEGTEDPSTTEL